MRGSEPRLGKSEGLREYEVAILPRASWSNGVLASLLGSGHAPRRSIVLPNLAVPVVDGRSRISDGVARHPTTVNLGEQSLFYGLRGRRYFSTRGAGETNAHHRDPVQQYQVDREILASDAVVNVTTLRTDRMTGIASSLHNVVGISTNSNWLPRHSIGTPKTGGDSYPRNSVRSRLACAMLPARQARLGRSGRTRARGQIVEPGSWWGNDTLWRTILDLNRALLYGREDGTLASGPQRKTFAIVSAVRPSPVPHPAASQLVIAGPNFSAVDLVCTRLLGFDWKRIPHISHVFDDHDAPLIDFRYEDIVVHSEIAAFDRRLVDIDRVACFAVPAPAGWDGWLGKRDGSI